MIWFGFVRQRGGYWSRVVAHLNRTLNRKLELLPMGCLLRTLKRPTRKKAGNRLIDLALAVTRKNIAHHWKSTTGPTYELWVKEVEQWYRAETEAIVQEEMMGVRLRPLSST